MKKIMDFLNKNKIHTNNDNSNNDDNINETPTKIINNFNDEIHALNDSYCQREIFNPFGETQYETQYEIEYKRKLNLERQKYIIEKEKKSKHEMWIKKMENSKSINDKDDIIISKILLMEANIRNKNKKREYMHIYEQLFIFNDNPEYIRNCLNCMALFKNKDKDENIET
jgi:hypothetical protein